MPKVAEVEKTDAQKLATALNDIVRLQKQLTDRDNKIDALQKKVRELEDNLTQSQKELLSKFIEINTMRDYIERCHQGRYFAFGFAFHVFSFVSAFPFEFTLRYRGIEIQRDACAPSNRQRSIANDSTISCTSGRIGEARSELRPDPASNSSLRENVQRAD